MQLVILNVVEMRALYYNMINAIDKRIRLSGWNESDFGESDICHFLLFCSYE